jgi:hypothetical protein
MPVLGDLDIRLAGVLGVQCEDVKAAAKDRAIQTMTHEAGLLPSQHRISSCSST